MGRHGYSFVIKGRADRDTILAKALDRISGDESDFDTKYFKVELLSSVVADRDEAERVTNEAIEENEGAAVYFYDADKNASKDFYELKATKSKVAKIQKLIEKLNMFTFTFSGEDGAKVAFKTCHECGSKINTRHAIGNGSCGYRRVVSLGNFSPSNYGYFKGTFKNGFHLCCPACTKGVLAHSTPPVLAKLMESVEALNKNYQDYVMDEKRREVNTFVNLVSGHY
jgi:hypothetical protein